MNTFCSIHSNVLAKRRGGGGAGVSDYASLIAAKPPWGIYDAANYTTDLLPDTSGNGRDATCASCTLSSGSGNGADTNLPYISGTTTSSVLWPAGSIPSTFTICAITRYTGTTGGGRRVLCGKITGGSPNGINVALGHYEGYVAQGYFNDINFQSINLGTANNAGASTTNWLVSCCKNKGSTNKMMTFNGVACCNISSFAGNQSAGQLCVNLLIEPNQQQADFALSMVYIWNQDLTDAELDIMTATLTNYMATGTIS